MGLEALRSRQSAASSVSATTPARRRSFVSPGIEGAAPTLSDLDARIEAAASFGHNIALLRSSGSGRPLPRAVQSKMERAFGREFSRVRVHEDRSPLSMGALAYTRGKDIHFAPGEYQPGSRSGQELIGHELTHVVQQQAGRVAIPQGKGLPINENSHLEAEADAMGARAAQGLSVAGTGGAEPAFPQRSAFLSGTAGPVQCMRRLGTLWQGAKSGGKGYFSQGGGGKKPVDDIMEKIRAKQKEIEARNAKFKNLKGKGVDTDSSFRYLNAENPKDFQPPIVKTQDMKALNKVLANVEKDPHLKKKLARGHETGELHGKSPYVSVAKDFVKAALTTDDWLSDITTKSPHLALLHTPKGSLTPPHSALSKKETEHLYLGPNLKQFVAKTIRNPMLGGIPRFGSLPPDVIAALGEQNERRYDRGREAQHEKLVDRLKKKSGKGGGN